MVQKLSHEHGNDHKKVVYDEGGVHFTELMEIALDEPEAFDFLLKCFDLDIDNANMLKLIAQII